MKSNERNRLIREYYEQIGSDMEYEKFEKICKTPFIHVRRQMVGGKLPEIRLMYFGTFKVFASKIVGMLKYTQERFDKSLITQQQYDDYINILITFVKDNSQKFSKVKEKIKQWIYL